MNVLKKQILEFDAAHNYERDGCLVLGDGWVRFSDGAMREIHPWGQFCEPVKDDFQRVKDILIFYEGKFNLAVEEFHIFRQNLLAPVHSNLQQKRCPPCFRDRDDILLLKKLRTKVKHCQGKVEEAQKAVEAAKPDWLKQKENDSHERAATQSFIEEVEKIEI